MSENHFLRVWLYYEERREVEFWLKNLRRAPGMCGEYALAGDSLRSCHVESLARSTDQSEAR